MYEATLNTLRAGTYFIWRDGVVRRLERGQQGQCYAPVQGPGACAERWYPEARVVVVTDSSEVARSIN